MCINVDDCQLINYGRHESLIRAKIKCVHKVFFIQWSKRSMNFKGPMCWLWSSVAPTFMLWWILTRLSHGLFMSILFLNFHFYLKHQNWLLFKFFSVADQRGSNFFRRTRGLNLVFRGAKECLHPLWQTCPYMYYICTQFFLYI